MTEITASELRALERQLTADSREDNRVALRVAVLMGLGWSRPAIQRKLELTAAELRLIEQRLRRAAASIAR